MGIQIGIQSYEGTYFPSTIQSEDMVKLNKTIFTDAEGKSIGKRENINMISDSRISEKARQIVSGVGGLIKNDRLIAIEEGKYEYEIKGRCLDLADGEEFRDEPSGCFGSIFLISSKYMLTAGHNLKGRMSIDQKTVEGVSVVFGFVKESNDQKKYTIPEENVYKIKKVVKIETSSNGLDYALIKLNKRVINGIKPLEIDFEDVKVGDKIYVIGQSEGLPMKCSYDAEIKKNRNENRFDVDTQTFGGNSGSPVIDEETNKVNGIFVKGFNDYRGGDKPIVPLTREKISKVTTEKHGYEEVVKISRLRKIIEKEIYKKEKEVSGSEMNNSQKKRAEA